MIKNSFPYLTSTAVALVFGVIITGAVLGFSLSSPILPASQLAQIATGNTYYVSPTGDDSSNGTITSPWKTIGKANNTLQAGDTVLIRAGTYKEDLTPINSGTAGKPIIYKGFPGEQVYVQGDNNTTPIIVLHGKNYITYDHLNIYYGTTPSFGKAKHTIEIWGGGHLAFRDIHIVSNSNATIDHAANLGVGAMYFGENTADNLVENVEIRNLRGGLKFQEAFRNTVRNSVIVDHFGDSFRIDSAKGKLQGLLIENNLLGGSLVSDGIQTNADFDLLTEDAKKVDTSNRGIIIRNNVIYGTDGENAIDLKGSSDIVVEGNILYGHPGNNDGVLSDGVLDRNVSKALTHGSGASSNNVIIRNNVVYDNSSGVRLDRGWKIYNNTIVNNNRDYTGGNSAFVANANKGSVFHGIGESSGDQFSVFKNNIVGDHFGPEISLQNNSRATFDYNLYFNTTKTPVFKQDITNDIGTLYTGLDAWKTYLASLASIKGKDTHSFVALPKFVNVPSHPVGPHNQFDFRLAAGSPAINAGGPLTTTTSAGSGTVVVVGDTRFFFDGYGITDGDTIQIGDQVVKVTAIDYTNNKLTIDRSISWVSGAWVSLPYNGTAPDIGAYEYSGTTPPPSSPCESFSNTTQIPSGYGASYNLFTTAKELLLNITCNTNNTASLSLGNGQLTTYIWNQAYYTKNGTTWNPVTLTGSNTKGNWIIGQATASPSLTTTEQQTQNYIASYICIYTSSTWKCGCSDTACATPKWNLQGVKR